MDRIFRRGEILLPRGVDLTKWSVVACDQFTAQPAYWEALDRAVGDAPSALRLVLPEAYLETRDLTAAAAEIRRRMDAYLAGGVFQALPESYVYLRRTLQSGAVRQGLLGLLDLEGYDYGPNSVSPVRATEGTIADRLPPRVRIRREAVLEMPHILVFIDDPADTVFAPLAGGTAALEELYDFDLAAGGGHLRGWRVTGGAADRADAALDALAAPERPREREGDGPPVRFAVGDGNHSLAAAKSFWEKLKPALPPSERERHPARYALVELVNLHDPAITFEPIHRCLFGTDPAAFLREAKEVFTERYRGGSRSHLLRLATGAGEETVAVPGLSIGRLIGAAEEFCQNFLTAHGGGIDYIHSDGAALELARRPGCAGLLLPKMEKAELFPSVVRSGPFPKKSFSIGLAEDKRYYLEARRIIP